MPRADELREPVREIAKAFQRKGFKIVDLASVGIWLIKDLDPNKLAEHIEHLESLSEAGQIVNSSSEDSVSRPSKKKRRSVNAKVG